VNDYLVRREKNALKIALKAMYLVELGKQVLEWRITAPNNETKCVPDNKLSFSGNDLLSLYIGGKHPDTDGTEQSPLSFPKVRMTWTGNKVDLVELIYAWEKVGCFNHGHVNIKEIVAYIEIIFNIDLGDYYHTFLEMRNRASRTAFLNKLIKFLNDRMDEVDRRK
jgi:hypothetical protein